jgi:Fe-S-cluster containining protein
MDIDDLCRLIPEFLCTPGCHECCRRFGVPSRTQVEEERIQRFTAERGMAAGQARGTTCPYLVVGLGCSIYPVRPLICRIYGTSPTYRCVMGVSPLRLLHEDEEVEIFHRYYTDFV